MSSLKNVPILRIVSHRGLRTEYQVGLNGSTLRGRVVKTHSKGQTVWFTQFKDQRVEYYDPEWLARRNSRTVTLDINAPFMSQVKAAREAEKKAA